MAFRRDDRQKINAEVNSNSLGNGNIVHCWLSPFEILFDGQTIHELHGQVTLALHKLRSTCNYEKHIKCCYKRNMWIESLYLNQKQIHKLFCYTGQWFNKGVKRLSMCNSLWGTCRTFYKAQILIF